MAKADIVKRVAAYIIDSLAVGLICLLIVGITLGIFMAGFFVQSLAGLTTVIYVIGLVFAIIIPFVYVLLRDGLFGGRSLGKKFMNLRVVNTKTNKPCSFKDSFLRNITLFIPIVSIIELIMPFIDAGGLRFGDKLAGTQVVG